jgi:hypothetical protein
MKRTVILNSGTSAILIGSAIAFSVHSKDFKNGTKPTVCMNLAGTETATICKPDSDGTAQPVRNGVMDRANEGCVTLESPGIYMMYKDATVANADLVLENGT